MINCLPPKLMLVPQLTAKFFDDIVDIVDDDLAEIKKLQDKHTKRALLDMNSVYRVEDNDHYITIHYQLKSGTSYMNINMTLDSFITSYPNGVANV